MLHGDIRLQTFSELSEANCNEKVIGEKIKECSFWEDLKSMLPFHSGKPYLGCCSCTSTSIAETM